MSRQREVETKVNTYPKEPVFGARRASGSRQKREGLPTLKIKKRRYQVTAKSQLSNRRKSNSAKGRRLGSGDKQQQSAEEKERGPAQLVGNESGGKIKVLTRKKKRNQKGARLGSPRPGQGSEWREGQGFQTEKKKFRMISCRKKKQETAGSIDLFQTTSQIFTYIQNQQ